MATGQSEQLKQFQELAEAVLRVTERQERLTERQERLMERAEACAGTFEQLESRVAGRQRSRESTVDEAYRSHSRQVDELTGKVRWASQTWTWKPLMWGAVGGLAAGAVSFVTLFWLAVNPDSPFSRFLLP